MTIIQAPAAPQVQQASLVELGKNLLAASRDGFGDDVATLLAKGAPMTTDWLGTSPLHLAALNGHHDIAEILMRSGCSKDARTKVDKTPLHLAATEGHSALVEVLLRTGAEVDSKDMLKMTPLHWAVQRGCEDSVEVLLRYGADVNLENKFAKTPFEVATGINRPDIIELLQNAEHIRATLTILPTESDPLTVAATQSITEDLQSQTDMEELVHSISTTDNQIQIPEPEHQEDAMKLLASHGITYLPEDDAASIGLSSDQTLKLTKAGELALNKISVQAITSSNVATTAKVITTMAGKQINQPVRIITLNSLSKHSNVTKIQSKPIVINAPYVIPQTNRTATKIQSESGERKGPKIIRLTPEQFAAIKSGGAKLQGLHTSSASVVTTKQSQPIFFKSEGGVIKQKLNTTQLSSFQSIQQQASSQGKTVKIVRLNPNMTIGQPHTLSATLVPSPLKKGVVTIAPKTIKTETPETSSIIPSTTSLEEVEDESSTATAEVNGAADPKEALRKKLKEIEAMNEELRRRNEEADELKRQLEEC